MTKQAHTPLVSFNPENPKHLLLVAETLRDFADNCERTAREMPPKIFEAIEWVEQRISEGKARHMEMLRK